GRLHRETLGMIARIQETYGYRVQSFHPDPQPLQAWVARHGADAFYDGVDLRKECCRLRKVEPLGRALAGKHAWITGQRRAQSSTRAELALKEQDPAHGMVKFNPLAEWTEEQVWRY